MTNEVISVLYVEDNPSDVELTRRELKRVAPYIALDVVGTQTEALKKLGRVEANPYDVVLIDRNLPDGDGLSLLAHIRGRTIPAAAIMVTGGGDEELVIAALRAGADDYIIKSSNYLENLVPTIEAALKQYRSQTFRKSHQVKVLYAEHNATDVDLTERYIAAHAPNIQLQVVSTAAQVLAAFDKPDWAAEIDVLLVDYRLPGANALELAKELRQVRGIDIPIVLVTGQGAEEIALQSLKLGISDYLPKTHDYLNRLPLVLEDAYHRYQLVREQAALLESERRYRSLFIDSPIALIEEDFSLVLATIRELQEAGVKDISRYFRDNHDEIFRVFGLVQIREMNRAARNLYGLPEDDSPITQLSPLMEVDNWLPPYQELVYITQGKTSFILETTNQTYRNRKIHINLYWLALSGYEQTLERVIVAIEDVTERKEAADRIQQQLHQLNALRAIDEAISSNLDLRVTLRVLLEQLLKQLNADAAAILLYHSGLRELEYVAQQGFRQNFPGTTRLAIGSGYAGIAAQRSAGLSVFDLQTDHDHLPDGIRHIYKNILGEGFKFCLAVPLSAKGNLVGVLEVYLRSQPSQDTDWTHFLELLAGQAAIAVDNARLFEDLQRSNIELVRAYDATIEGWTRALDLRDKETEGHTQRVVELTLRLCKAAGMNAEELIHVRRGALLHDIGKMGVPDSILHKPGPLDDEEWEIMHKHPVYAYEMLAPISYLREAMDIPYCHHEHWDGSGYPRGLKGEQIPLSARIFSIVDMWDALRSDRPYRPAWSVEQTKDYILEQKGKLLAPEVVDLFFDQLDL
jgi:response regulator RpfG family c-di-GMP phosphodiesterase